MPTPSLHTRAEAYFAQQLGVSFDALLAPVSAAAPAGHGGRGSAAYAAINEARRRDDPSLPMGAWEHELKRADWGEVSRLIVQALQNESKDLQLLAWLLEAQIRQQGLDGIAACLVLTRAMCVQYWDNIAPTGEGGDLEHRANIVGWIGEKTLPALRLAPLIGIGRERQYGWSDWEQAHRNEQIRMSMGKGGPAFVPEGVSLQELQGAVGASATETFISLRLTLACAIEASAELSAALDPLFGAQAPSLGGMNKLLEQMHTLVEGELYKRGVRPLAENAAQDGASATASTAAPPLQLVLASGAIRDRADAYARLAETAEYLMRIEPHSPVPYLVRRATQWGGLNTVELYQELFLKLNGQLNIFEMLGLHAQTGAPPA